MATCKDCLHYDVCGYKTQYTQYYSAEDCYHFKDKNNYAEVKHGTWFKSLGGAYFCSNCGMNATYDFSKNQVLGIACTYCGIKIDGKEVGSD